MRVGEWDQWKRSMMTMDEGTFFDLIRNYLGKIKTPFHKPSLVENLRRFLISENVQSSLLERLGEEDRLVLTAIGSLPFCDLNRLSQFLGSAHSFLGLYHRVHNLQERLFIFWYQGEEGKGWVLSPFLSGEPWSQLLQESLLLSGDPPSAPSQPLPWLQDGFALAIRSMLYHNKIEQDQQGQVKKRSKNRFEDIFGGFFVAIGLSQEVSLLPRVLEWLTRLGLVEISASRFLPSEKAWNEFWELDAPRRLALYWAAWICSEREEILPLAAFMPRVLSAPGESSLSLEAYYRWYQLASPNWRWKNTFLDDLVLIGVLAQEKESYYQVSRALSLLEEAGTQVPVPLGSTFVFSLDLAANSTDVLDAVVLGEIQKFDFLTNYLVGQSGVYQFMENHPERKDPVSVLETFSAQKVPGNLEFSIRQWQDLYGAIRIEKALVVRIDESTLGFLENIPGFDRIFVEELARGVYLMKESGLDLLEEILEEQNRPIPPVIDLLDRSVPKGSRWTFYPWKLESREAHRVSAPSLPENAPEPISLPPGLSPEEERDFQSRLDRGLILFPQQISKGLHPWEKTTAQGLDFLGKIRIIESVIREKKWLLEIRLPGKEAVENILVNPLRLDKKGEDTYLFCHILPEEKPLEIKASKLARVVKVRALI